MLRGPFWGCSLRSACEEIYCCGLNGQSQHYCMIGLSQAALHHRCCGIDRTMFAGNQTFRKATQANFWINKYITYQHVARSCSA